MGIVLSRVGAPLLAAMVGVAVVGTTSVSGCADPEEDADATSGDLIGGQIERGQYPSAVTILDGCSAAKVAPRKLLTAAHCIEKAPEKFTAGATMRITNAAIQARLHSASAALSLTVREVAIPQRRRTQCADGTCLDVANAKSLDTPDVAVITTDEEIGGLPSAVVDLDPVYGGDAVVIVGSGCEQALNATYDYAKRKLKFHPTKALFPDAAFHPGSGLWDMPGDPNERLTTLESSYFVTPGPQRDGASAAGLCPGDSGGPVYRAGLGSTAAIVGVNATYTFQSPIPVPVTNGHTRLDDKARWVAGFFASAGVPTVRSCTMRSCGPPPAHDAGRLVDPGPFVPTD